MKKMMAILLLLTFLLSGCSGAADHIQQTENDPKEHSTPAGAEDTESITEDATEIVSISMPMITVSVPVITEEHTAEDGTVIFRNIQQNMYLVMQDPDVADRIIIDFLNRIDQAVADKDNILQQAQAAYNGLDSWTPYLSSVTYDPMRIDQSVLSLFGSNVHYSGTSHAVHTSCAANYNVVTGDVLTLGSIIVNSDSVEKLCTLVTEKLQAVAEEKHLRQGFESTVQQRFAGEESYDEDWYFTTTGLCFYFEPYAVAPYASGIITAEIPYSELVGIIDDAFFPPEQTTVTGTVVAVPVESVDMSQFTRISEVVLKSEAPMYVIYTDSAVQNLKITLTDAVLGGEFTVFAAQSISNTDAVIVQAETNVFRLLNIIYESNGETMTTPLFTE